MNYWAVPAILSLSGAGGKGTNEQLRSSATDKDSMWASKSILGAVWLTLVSVKVKLVRSKITFQDEEMMHLQVQGCISPALLGPIKHQITFLSVKRTDSHLQRALKDSVLGLCCWWVLTKPQQDCRSVRLCRCGHAAGRAELPLSKVSWKVARSCLCEAAVQQHLMGTYVSCKAFIRLIKQKSGSDCLEIILARLTVPSSVWFRQELFRTEEGRNISSKSQPKCLHVEHNLGSLVDEITNAHLKHSAANTGK